MSQATDDRQTTQCAKGATDCTVGQKRLKLLPQMSDFKAKNAPNSTSAGASPQTPPGKLTALPQTP